VVKMYTDGVVEGTPEEIAAFKHIDAHLTAREHRPVKAIEAKKPPGKVTASKRVKTQHRTDKRVRTRRTSEQIEEMNNQLISMASANVGVTANDVALYFGMNKKTAYNRLYQLRVKGLLGLADDGSFIRVGSA